MKKTNATCITLLKISCILYVLCYLTNIIDGWHIIKYGIPFVRIIFPILIIAGLSSENKYMLTTGLAMLLCLNLQKTEYQLGYVIDDFYFEEFIPLLLQCTAILSIILLLVLMPKENGKRPSLEWIIPGILFFFATTVRMFMENSFEDVFKMLFVEPLDFVICLLPSVLEEITIFALGYMFSNMNPVKININTNPDFNLQANNTQPCYAEIPSDMNSINTLLNELSQLGHLKEVNILTENEFESKKKQILQQISSNIDPNYHEKQLERMKKEEEEEREARWRAYWNEHREEKEALENKRSEAEKILNQISPLAKGERNQLGHLIEMIDEELMRER